MKKLFALLLAMMMIFSLAACGDNNTTDPDKDNPGVSQSGENNNSGEENKGTGLWDVADADITILNEGHDVAIVPAGLKKGIGTQSKAQIYLRDPGSTFASIYKSLYEANYEEVAQADVDTVHIFVHPPMDKRKDAQNAPDTQKAFIKAPPRCRQASAP